MGKYLDLYNFISSYPVAELGYFGSGQDRYITFEFKISFHKRLLKMIATNALTNLDDVASYVSDSGEPATGLTTVCSCPLVHIMYIFHLGSGVRIVSMLVRTVRICDCIHMLVEPTANTGILVLCLGTILCWKQLSIHHQI